MDALRERDEYNQLLRAKEMEDKQIKDDARATKLRQQAALREAYENQMAQKDQAKRQTRLDNDQFANEYKNYLDNLDAQRNVPKSAHVRKSQNLGGDNYGTGLQIGEPTLAPRNVQDSKHQLQNNIDNVYTGLPIGYNQQPRDYPRVERSQISQKENIHYGDIPNAPKSKVELNREKQMADKQYTGFHIGAIPEQSRNDRNRANNNYHAMLDEQVQLKREAARIKKASDDAQIQDSLDYQMRQIDRSQHDRAREHYQDPNLRNDTMSQQSDYDRIKNRYGNHAKGYNILTGN